MNPKKEKQVETTNNMRVLRLYVARQTPKDLTAFMNLKKICKGQLNGKYSIEVIDLLKNLQLEADNQILALPTLVRKLQALVRKIIGNLSQIQNMFLSDLTHGSCFVKTIFIR